MDVETLEREALKLSAEDRTRLAQELLESLDEFPPKEIDRLWLSEVARRAEEIDSGHIELVEIQAQTLADAHCRRRPGCWFTRA